MYYKNYIIIKIYIKINCKKYININYKNQIEKLKNTEKL